MIITAGTTPALNVGAVSFWYPIPLALAECSVQKPALSLSLSQTIHF